MWFYIIPISCIFSVLYLLYTYIFCPTFTITYLPPNISKQYQKYCNYKVYIDLDYYNNKNTHKHTLIMFGKIVLACINKKDIYIYGKFNYMVEKGIMMDICKIYGYRLVDEID